MSKWKWFALIPVLAAALVFGPGIFGSGNPSGGEAEGRSWEPATGAVPSGAPSMLEVAACLGLVLVLAVGGMILLRRLQYGTPHAGGTTIQMRETRRLGPKRALHMLRVSDRLLLVAESEQGIHLVADLTPADPDEDVAEPIADDPDDDDEDGAVPRDLVIPRPRQRARPKRAALANFRDLLDRLG